jgi:hypothetical protein
MIRARYGWFAAGEFGIDSSNKTAHSLCPGASTKALTQ